MKRVVLLLVSFSALAFVGCTPSADQLEAAMKKNPKIIYAAIEADPAKFLEVVNKAAQEAQAKQRENAEKEEVTKLEEEFKNPKVAVIADNRAIFGKKDAPITIVEYSDFECPFCSRGHATIDQVMSKYGDKVRVVYKNLPLEFHPNAMPAAKMYEAVALQGADKAKKFYDEVFKNQDKMKSGGAKFLAEAARKAGANVDKAKKDAEGEAVAAIIKADMEEAKKFGFQGTPGFLINGVSIRGAYPLPEFEKIIERHLKK